MVVELHVFGGSPNYSAKSSVGFVMHVVVELIRIGIGSTLGAYFLPNNLARERGNAGAFSLLWYCFCVSMVLAAFQCDSLGEAFVTGIILSVVPSVSVHAALCYLNPEWRSCAVLGDIVGAMVSYGLTMAAMASVAM